MKKALLALGAVLVVLALAVAALFAVTFGGLKAIEDGQELGGGARVVRDGFVAAYLLPSSDNVVALVDCGNDAQATAILAALKKRGLGADAVRVILLTHGHADHTAGCHNFPLATVYAFAQDKGLALGTEHAHGPLTSFSQTPPEKRTKVDQLLVDGESINLGTLQVRAFAVPGHTAGSAAFVANEVLYLGDSAGITSDGKLRPAPWIFTDDPAQNRAQLKGLAARLTREKLAVKQLAPSHSGVGEGLDALTNFD